ncbi:MAG: glycosyltransferase family 1 protein [Acidobacteriaceae bacterium]|nr:glycosyltransferase family 1 protein [Acidobacteriaceae bacterium]
MKIVLTNFGTVGEIYPLLALAQELEESGHEAKIALSPDYEDWVTRLGLRFVSVGPPAKAITTELTLAATRDPLVFESPKASRELFRPLRESIPAAYEQLREACRGYDLLVSGHLQPAAKMVHETDGIPYVSLCATVISPGGTSPGYQRATQSLVNPYRSKLGLSPVADPLAGDSLSDELALYALSSHVLTRPASWPAFYHLVGYFHLHEEDWQPDGSLADFLLSGPPPVVVAFGSMVLKNSDELTQILVRAGQEARCRVIIQQGWSGLGRQALPENMYSVGYAPHDWLFSRASCVVHHGGSGTSAAVFRAGVPAIFIPHILDQPLWASCAQRLGVAGPEISPSELTSQKLAAAIRTTTNNPRYGIAAKELMTKIRSEHGTRRARLLIEQTYASKVRPSSTQLSSRILRKPTIH